MALMISGCEQNDKDFMVETLAMAIGYEMRNDFDWNKDVDAYYNAIMAGKLSLDAAQLAEGYLRGVTHPLLANRFVALAGRVGFDLNELGSVVGVGNVDIKLLQTAATGFRMGLLLK